MGRKWSWLWVGGGGGGAQSHMRRFLIQETFQRAVFHE